MNAKQKKAIEIFGITIGVYVIFRYLLIYVLPFLIAYFFVRLFYPFAKKAEEKLHVKKEMITLLTLLSGLVLVAAGLWFLAAKICAQLRNVIRRISLCEAEAEKFLRNCCDGAERLLGIRAEDAEALIEKNIIYIEEKIQIFLVGDSLGYLMGGIKVLGVFFVIFIAVILLVRDYDEIRQRLAKYVWYHKAARIGMRLWNVGGAYLKAQGIITLTVTVVCVAVLWMTGNPYALLVGTGIGLLDVLPFLGTGTVLVPWALICLAQKNYAHAAAYIVLFLITYTMREYLEPKLVGDKLGIYPIVIAMVVYVGVCIYGVSGVLLGPVSLMVIFESIKEL